MLELALYVIIFEFIDRFFSRHLKKKLAIEGSSTKRILIRKMVRRNRIVLLSCFIIFLIGTEVFLVYDAITLPYNSFTTKNCILFPFVCLIYFMFQHKWKRIKGNISTSDLDSFNYKKVKYTLFLRGFDNDDYNKIDTLENPKVEKYEHLSEYWFFKFLSKKHKLPIVSVGMTKELDSPLGTKRIYLDDEDWKEGVKTLMEYADRIFILVNDRDSCIWEISQSKDFLCKTFFIVDDKHKYEVAKEKVKDLFDLPAILLPVGKCAIVQFNPNAETHYFENSRMGYAIFWGSKYTTTKTKKKRFIWGCLVPMAALYAFFILPLIIYSIFNNSSKEEISDYNNHIKITISPFNEIKSVVSQIQLPMDIGSGLTIVSIEVLEKIRNIRYVVDVNEEIIDMDLLRQYAKQNILEAIITGDIHSHELQFWLYCMTHNISLEYHYRSTSDANNRFEFILTIEELKNAFQRNKAIDQSLLNAKETRH